MKNVLLPTDFSKNSVNAIHYAVQLLKDTVCNFHLLNTFQIAYMPHVHLSENDAKQMAMMDTDLFEDSQKGLDEIIETCGKVSKHKFYKYSLQNDLIDSIKQFIQEVKVDLIIMGTKGATGAKEIFIGSNTGKVLVKTDVPLLVIPEEAAFKGLKEIVLPTDLKVPYKEADFDMLFEFVKQYDARVHILNVQNKVEIDEDQKNNKRALEEYFYTMDYRYHSVIDADYESGINFFTKSRANIDMIAIVARHHHIFQRIFFMPKSEKLCFHTKIPLLVLHKVK